MNLNRRTFVKTTCATLAGTATISMITGLDACVIQDNRRQKRRKIKKSVKWGMVGAGDSTLEKFEIQKELGYDGVEFISPTEINLDEVVEASKKTGLPVHGLVDTKHWEIRLSSPDEKQREQGIAILNQCLADCSKLGGDSVLLVPGQVTGNEETHDDVWKRSIACIRKVIPSAEKQNVKILIENVWNGFCEQPETLRDYIDEIASPWVQVYFDIGNARKFAPSEKWVQVLAKRIAKLDVKDWGQENGFCKIGDGDVDWPAVCKELDELEFDGWCTAEVEGGGKEQLQDIAQRMDRVLVK